MRQAVRDYLYLNGGAAAPCVTSYTSTGKLDEVEGKGSGCLCGCTPLSLPSSNVYLAVRSEQTCSEFSKGQIVGRVRGFLIIIPRTLYTCIHCLPVSMLARGSLLHIRYCYTSDSETRYCPTPLAWPRCHGQGYHNLWGSYRQD
jgi:hypothetical protein